MPDLTKKDKQGLALVGIVLIALGALLALFFASSNATPLDARLCSSNVARKTVFLVDRSDDTPSQTVAEIRNRIEKTINSDVSEGELVSIFYITDTAQQDLRPAFSRCKPKSDANEAVESRRLIEKRYSEEFQEPLSRALDGQISGSEVSPLAEVLTDFLSSDYLDAKRNRLVIFSDLMQNSNSLNLYACSAGDAAIADYRSARAGALERPELRNVEVLLNLIPRQGLGAQPVACREQFWAWFFGDNEGEHAGVATSYLPGGATVQ